MRLIDADKLDWWYKGRPIRRVIDEAPTVDAVPVVHGRWIRKEQKEHAFSVLVPHCSECGALRVQDTMNYCPNCGARMDGDPK